MQRCIILYVYNCIYILYIYIYCTYCTHACLHYPKTRYDLMADEDEHHFLSMWISAKKLGPDIPKKGYGHSYHLVMTNSSPWYR